MSAIYHMILTGILINLSQFLQNQNGVRLQAKNIIVKENMVLWKYKKQWASENTRIYLIYCSYS